MKHCACVLWGLGAVLGTGLVAAQEPPVLTQEYRAEEGRPGFWWTRRLDEYTLQFMRVAPARMAMSPVTAADGQRPVQTSLPVDGADAARSAFFIGNTIANLRGLDPSFGCRTLTLIDGRRVAGKVTTPPAPEAPSPQPAAVRTPAPETQLNAADLEVWLVKRDGTAIDPQRRSAPEARYCDAGYTYGFDLAEARDAVAVVVKVGDRTYRHQLEPFADQRD